MRQHRALEGLELVVAGAAGAEQGVAAIGRLGEGAHRGEVGRVGAAQREVEPAAAVGGRAADQPEVVGTEGHGREASEQLGDGLGGVAVDARPPRALRESDLDCRALVGLQGDVDSQAGLGRAGADERLDVGGAEGAQRGDQSGGLEQVGLSLAVRADEEDAGCVGVDIREREVAEVHRPDPRHAHGVTWG